MPSAWASSDELRVKCDQAVRQCPKQAISIDES
jgi:hypothetical protein